MFSSSHVLERGDIATKFTHGGLGILMVSSWRVDQRVRGLFLSETCVQLYEPTSIQHAHARTGRPYPDMPRRQRRVRRS